MSPQRPPVVGIDLGATNINAGVVDAGDRIVGRAAAKTDAAAGRDLVVANIVRAVHEACESAGTPLDDVGAVGVAAAGAMDIPRGVILDAPNLHWTDVPLRGILHKELGRPVLLDNDVNGAVWGECHLGAGRGRGDVLGVWVGTGIGGGLVLGGRLYHGDRFTAGEVGNTVIMPGGPRGERTVEDLCSRTGMLRLMRKRVSDHLTSPIAALAEEDDAHEGTQIIAAGDRNGDELVTSVVDRGCELLGIAIANWVTVLSLDTVILGGGITEALGERYVERVRRSFEADVFPARLRDCELRVTELQADAALLGAALLARELNAR